MHDLAQRYEQEFNMSPLGLLLITYLDYQINKNWFLTVSETFRVWCLL